MLEKLIISATNCSHSNKKYEISTCASTTAISGTIDYVSIEYSAS